MIKIISGGQTGVDRAALDAAIKAYMPHGGWCPKGRLSEAGPLPSQYQLNETPSEEYAQRTLWNIRDSDATLIFVPSLPLQVTDGTVLTIEEVKKQSKPYLIVDLSRQTSTDEIINWIKDNHVNILNVAGPRESQSPGIYAATHQFMVELCVLLKDKYRKKL
ncbi:MAG: putative molybdenum carrier protein [Gammaproteobacteria bacterium]